MTARRVRVAICDDSRSYAEAARSFLEADKTLEVVAIAGSAEELVADLARARPDLVTMDLELPGIGGAEAIRLIMATNPLPIVVLSAYVARGGSSLADALTAGAVDSVAKSELRLDRRMGPRAVQLRRRLAALATPRADAPRWARLGSTHTSVRASARAAATINTPASGRGVRSGLPHAGTVSVIGVAASAGGPAALAAVLGLLPPDFGLPVLVVQHMSQGFTVGLAEWLSATVPPPVGLARDGEPARPGIVIAPDGAHLTVDNHMRLRVDPRNDGHVHQPSADILFGSLARSAGRGAVAVVLTGMGRDGAAGVAAVCEAGGVALAERSDHAVLSGMPAAAEAAGAVPLELRQIGRMLAGVSSRRRR